MTSSSDNCAVKFPSMNSTPFKYASDIHNELKADLKRIIINDACIEETDAQNMLHTLHKWMCETPNNTTYRVNTLKVKTVDVIQHINDLLIQNASQLPRISTISELPEVVIIHSWPDSIDFNVEKPSSEVIVDAACGAAVLRGSHVFAPGVIGLPHGLAVDDTISVYADIVGCCKKGLVKWYPDDNKMFLGNGIIKQTRENLFRSNTVRPSGVAIYMTDVISQLPQLNDDCLPEGWALLQNLPSILCSRALNPQPGERILDMCAAPGNKTTHIYNLMQGQGTLIALEKNKSKLPRLRMNCEKFNASNVKIYCCDSTKAISDTETIDVTAGPPFQENTFDRVLLDSPCSALGQRPQLLNSITVKQLRSYVPLQRKLFSVAVRLLKPFGTLVYSTCTVTIAENEGIVSWALRTFPFLELVSVQDQIGSKEYGAPGYCIDGLARQESSKVCRFGPESETVGFFIACFIKKNLARDKNSSI